MPIQPGSLWPVVLLRIFVDRVAGQGSKRRLTMTVHQLRYLPDARGMFNRAPGPTRGAWSVVGPREAKVPVAARVATYPARFRAMTGLETVTHGQLLDSGASCLVSAVAQFLCRTTRAPVKVGELAL
jgi:hypothetical protein